MTNWSFDHVAETRAALRVIVDDPAYGAAALSNVRIMSEVLPSLLRGARLERSVLVTAAKESLASTMLMHVSDGMDPGLAVRLSARFLNTISLVPVEACYRVAAELALALGLISVEQADVLGSGGDPSPADAESDPDEQQAEGERVDLAPPETAGRPSPPPPVDGQTTAPWPDNAIAAAGEPEDDDVSGVGPGDGAQPVDPVGSAPGDPVGQQAYGAPLGVQPTQMLGPTSGLDPASQLAPLGGEWISHVVRDTVHPGLLAFNPPSEMSQGRSERIEVGVARTPELRDALTSGFRGRGLPEVVHVDAAPLMGVELRGSSFAIEALSPVEQLVVPLARWEFDVTPVRSGSQTLTLCVTIRIDSPFVGGGRIAVPVLERDIRIKVDVVYGTRRFVASNWQWLVGTAVGLGGGIAAWISLVH
jgi:hypothetical protein